MVSSLAAPAFPHCRACLPSFPYCLPCPQACSDASFIIPLGLAAPYAWRLVQCIRVYLDTGARPQLFNAIKYSTAFPVGGWSDRAVCSVQGAHGK
jgi:hypothetical protein